MIFVDTTSELDYNNNPNSVWGCYSEPVFAPGDILLQVNGLNLSTIIPLPSVPHGIIINVCDVTGAILEDASTYFDMFIASFTLSGSTYYYCNLRCNNYSPAMLTKGCFTLNVIMGAATGLPPIFSKFTQKYQIINDVVLPTGVIINICTDVNVATLCSAPPIDATCGKPYVKFSGVFDCIDTFTGDYYGNPSHYIGGHGVVPFAFIRQSWLQARLKKLPRAIKRTISINGRTQRTETTPKYTLQGVTPFPEWKMNEIENMMLANHLYVDGTEYQSDGGTPFAQFGKPQNCNYMYKLDMDIQDLYEWQVFGCTPVCVSQTYYYPIPF